VDGHQWDDEEALVPGIQAFGVLASRPERFKIWPLIALSFSFNDSAHTHKSLAMG
jgi:hypothetical protein